MQYDIEMPPLKYSKNEANMKPIKVAKKSLKSLNDKNLTFATISVQKTASQPF